MTDRLIDGVMEERIKNLELKYNTVDKKSGKSFKKEQRRT